MQGMANGLSGGMSGGMTQAQTARREADPDAPTVTAGLTRAQQINDRLRNAVGALDRIADDLRGNEPQPETKGPGQVGPTNAIAGSLFGLRETQQETGVLLSFLDAVVARLQMAAG